MEMTLGWGMVSSVFWVEEFLQRYGGVTQIRFKELQVIGHDKKKKSK